MLLGTYKKSNNRSLSFLVKYMQLYRLRLKKKKTMKDGQSMLNILPVFTVLPQLSCLKHTAFKLLGRGEGICFFFSVLLSFLHLGESAFKKILSLFTGLKSDYINVQAVLPRSC